MTRFENGTVEKSYLEVLNVTEGAEAALQLDLNITKLYPETSYHFVGYFEN